MRRPRLHVPGACYHVTLRGNHQQDIFYRDADRRLLDRYVGEAAERVGVRIHAYCWMTNHVHLLVQVSDIPLGSFVQHVGTRFARAIQARVPTTGHLFQNRYHALLVDVDRYFVALLRYIHLNPVRAGLVRQPAAYPWSSHRAYLDLARTEWLTTEFGLRLFDADRERARERYRAFVMQEGIGVRDPSLGGVVRGEPRILGDESFARRATSQAIAITRHCGLEAIVAELCDGDGITLADLRSPTQRRDLSRLRGQITARALAEGAASLSEIARYLNRSASALSRAAERYG